MKARAWARRVCLVGIGLLYVASVPWYRESDVPMRVWLGLPDWVAVALLCYVGVASLNALAWLWTLPPTTVVSVSRKKKAPPARVRMMMTIIHNFLTFIGYS